jgi:hypothetical protein
LGAQQITLLVREAGGDMNTAPAQVRANAGIGRLYGQENDLEAVELIDLTSGATEKIAARHVIFASGRVPELVFIPAPTAPNPEGAPAADPVTGSWEALPPYKQPAYQQESGLLAKGDALTDFSAAIKAIAAGRRAAASIHRLLYNLPLELANNVVAPETMIQNVHRVELVPLRLRQLMPISDDKQIAQGHELEKGFSTAMAKTEAERCLRCGLICYRREQENATQKVAVSG